MFLLKRVFLIVAAFFLVTTLACDDEKKGIDVGNPNKKVEGEKIDFKLSIPLAFEGDSVPSDLSFTSLSCSNNMRLTISTLNIEKKGGNKALFTADGKIEKENPTLDCAGKKFKFTAGVDSYEGTVNQTKTVTKGAVVNFSEVTIKKVEREDEGDADVTIKPVLQD